MTTKPYKVIRTLLLCLPMQLFAVNAIADAPAAKTIRVIVPWSAGTGTDINARLVAKQIAAATGQTTIIDNRPGANGIIGTSEVLRAPADGNTILATSNAHVANQFLVKNVPYDAMIDFVPVGGTRKLPAMLVARPGLNINSLAQLTDLAKRNPGKISFGAGTTSALIGMELYQQMANVKLLHVPYKSATGALTDLVGGHIDVMLIDIVNSIGYIKDRKVVPLATTGKERMKALPDLPTVAESGYPGYEMQLWTGMWVRSGTPMEKVKFLNSMVNQAAALEKEQLEATGAETFVTTPSEFSNHIKSQVAFWEKATKMANISPQ